MSGICIAPKCSHLMFDLQFTCGEREHDCVPAIGGDPSGVVRKWPLGMCVRV